MISLKFGLVLLTLTGVAFSQRQIEDENILQQQKRILDLLRFVYQPTVIPEIAEISQTYKIEENLGDYRVPASVTNFLKIQHAGLLQRDQVFSILDEKQRKEVVSLFELLYFAKDFDTLYKTACWARVNVNPGLFVYALSAAVNHREDMKDIVLPPLYEINPHFFVDANVMQKASEMLVRKDEAMQEILVNANELDYMTNNNREVFPSVTFQQPENRMRYFTEDVTLNTYNNYYHLNNPFWMNITEGKRGELFWYYHQQLLARYLQERFSNDLTNFEAFRIKSVIHDGYNPRLRYPNGKYFTVRPDNMKLDDSNGYDVKLVEDFERRIRDAIDLGFVFGENGERIPIDDNNGIDHLGHLIQSTEKSTNKKYYGNLYQLMMQLLGRIVDPRRTYDLPPSVLEHFETALRDPLHYRIIATIIQLFSRLKSHLPSYPREILEFPGVKVDGIEVSRLNTFLEDFDMDVRNGIVHKLEDDFPVKVRHQRLNHVPFTYQINVTAEKPANAMVRVFLGLRHNPQGRVLDINERRKFMVQIDNFPIELRAGLNPIERKSEEITITRKRQPTMHELYGQVTDALEGNGKYFVEDVKQECGYPQHLLLPKGKLEGMPYSFFVAVTPYNPQEFADGKYGCGNGRGLFHKDQHPMGYPFDRIIDELEFNVPNFHEKEVLVYHTNAREQLA